MEQSEVVDRVLALTLDIEHAAAMANWPEAARLNGERTPLLHSIDAVQTSAGLAAIRRIQAIDAAVLAEASASRTALQSEFGAAMTRVQSVSVYHRVAKMVS